MDGLCRKRFSIQYFSVFNVVTVGLTLLSALFSLEKFFFLFTKSIKAINQLPTDRTIGIDKFSHIFGLSLSDLD